MEEVEAQPDAVIGKFLVKSFTALVLFDTGANPLLASYMVSLILALCLAIAQSKTQYLYPVACLATPLEIHQGNPLPLRSRVCG